MAAAVLIPVIARGAKLLQMRGRQKAGRTMDSIFKVMRFPVLGPESVPRVELVEYETSYKVKADIHDAGLDGVAVWIEAGVLTICTEDRSGFADGAVVLPHLNSFRFTLALPDDADETELSIECEGRVLSLTFGRTGSC